MQLKPLIFFVSGIAISWGATIGDVLNDLSNLQTGTTTLDNSINAFPSSGGSLIQALAIHTEATNVQSATTATTSDVNTLANVSEQDGTVVLNEIQVIKPIILAALSDIVAKKDAFAALPLGGVPALVLQDLQNLHTAVAALAQALIAKSPSDLTGQGQAIADAIDSAFRTAIAAFSS